MIGNFLINTIERDSLISAGLNPIIEKWEKAPVSALFNSNITGKRYLERFGYNLFVTIVIYYVEPGDITTYTGLNGRIIDFKEDTENPVTWCMNCAVEPFRHDGKSFYNAVRIELKTVSSMYETINGYSAHSPLRLTDINEAQDKFLGATDSSGNEFILEYN